jgi:hypothetical protein
VVVEAVEPRADTVDLIARLPSCDVKQRGILHDVGSPSVDPAREYAVGPFDDATNEERAGSTYANVRTRRIAYDFWLDDAATDVVVSFRAAGHAARKASVYLDNHRLGTVTLPSDDIGVRASSSISELAAGRHTVTLRFTGTPKTVEEPYAVIDWIRVGVKEDAPERYAAPTLDRLVTDVVLDDVPKRALVLRGPSTVRCSLAVVPGSELALSLGYWGGGRGVAQIRVVEDGEAPVVLIERKVSGGHGRTWTPLRFSLAPFENRLIGLEIRALESTAGGRVAFGEPEVQVKHTAPGRVPKAKIVVLVVGSGLDRRMVPPWGPVGNLATLGELGRAVAFDVYRAPTTVTSGVVASLFSGLASREHALEDPLARLPDRLPVIAERVKEASGRAAFFTGVPTSFAAFGFDRSWENVGITNYIYFLLPDL